jgi:hypothetical protein
MAGLLFARPFFVIKKKPPNCFGGFWGVIRPAEAGWMVYCCWNALDQKS